MTGDIGSFALLLGLVVAIYGAAASVIAARRESPLLGESARTSAYSLFALLLIANASMLVAILRNDFSLRYVAENSSRATPTYFKVLSLWAADDGSLLLWSLILTGFVAAVAFRFRRRRPESLPWVMAVMFAVSSFYLVLVLGPTTPFSTLATVPPDGRGPLPLLQNNPLMAVHPPLLYLGFIGFTVPFAFAIAALVTGRLSGEWIRITRRWTIAAWLFLTGGLVLGALWSYTVLGWGGYWAWDPVENVALLPWLLATAFLHSVIIQERRGMLKVWNLSLIVGTFAMTTLATFLTRGTILSSVHAFAVSSVGPLYLGFLTVVLLGGFGLIAVRGDRLRTEGRLDSVLSRESVFLGNNLALVAFTLTVLVGTIYPLLEEALSGRQVSVGAPYFRATTLPIALVLLLLAGAGPLLPWRAADGRIVRARLRIPLWAAVLVLVVLAVAGMRNLAAMLAFSLGAFVVVANASEIVRGVRAYRRAYGGGRLAAVREALARNRRLYGGLVVHLGVALLAVAIAMSSSFSAVADLRLSRGERASFAGYTFSYEGVRRLDQPQRTVLVTDLSVSHDGRALGTFSPSLNLYPASSQPIGTPSIRTGLVADMYVSLMSVDPGGRAADVRVYRNPGVVWVWIGGLVIVIGGLIAGWPGRRRRRGSVAAEEAVVRTREEVAVS